MEAEESKWLKYAFVSTLNAVLICLAMSFLIERFIPTVVVGTPWPAYFFATFSAFVGAHNLRKKSFLHAQGLISIFAILASIFGTVIQNQ